jgi:tRNA-modifying protein YgfZ
VSAFADFQQRGGVADLASRTKLLFTGADRVRYLNGQITANLATAKSPGVLPACVTTAKGKLCADVFVSIGPSGVLVDADAVLRDTLAARFEKYIVADDVTLEDVTERVAIVHCLGIVPERLEAISGLTPLPVNRYGIPGYDVFPPFRADLPPLGEKLAAEFAVLDDAFLDTLRIEQGVPRWGRELDENTLPPEAGLDRTHIDYHKGCYVGQEVISRLKSVGHVNRQLTGFLSPTGVALPERAEVCPADAPGQLCGTITSAAWSFALEKPVALGYLRRSAPAGALLAVAPASAPLPITPCELPFTK